MAEPLAYKHFLAKKFFRPNVLAMVTIATMSAVMVVDTWHKVLLALR